MSYILEALRRAEAERERERGTVPGLHAQARHMPEHDDEPAAARGPAALTWGALALAALALLGAGWWFLAPKSEPTAVVAVAPLPVPTPALPAPPASPVVAAPAAPPATAASRAMPAPAATGVAKARPVPAPQRGAAAASAPVVVAAPRMPLRMDRAAAPAPVAPGTSAAPRQALQPGATAASKAERLPRMAELPEALRRELPQMAIGGSINSPDPEARMVILNGQVRREGETVANGLVLTRIRANAAVFEYKGQLFEMPF